MVVEVGYWAELPEHRLNVCVVPLSTNKGTYNPQPTLIFLLPHQLRRSTCTSLNEERERSRRLTSSTARARALKRVACFRHAVYGPLRFVDGPADPLRKSRIFPPDGGKIFSARTFSSLRKISRFRHLQKSPKTYICSTSTMRQEQKQVAAAAALERMAAAAHARKGSASAEGRGPHRGCSRWGIWLSCFIDVLHQR